MFVKQLNIWVKRWVCIRFGFLIEIKTKFFLAKIHCISDIESIEKVTHTQDPTDLLPLHIIPKHTEQTIRKAIGEDQEAFVQEMVSFAMVNFS
jgi:hypothetical protein